MYYQLAIDFTLFCNRFGKFYNVVRDGLTDGQLDQWTDRPTDGWTNRWLMFFSYTDAIDTSKNDFSTDFAIFTEALQTNRPMDQHTNQHTL